MMSVAAKISSRPLFVWTAMVSFSACLVAEDVASQDVASHRVAAKRAEPWVSAFERFAAHDEIPAETAGALLISELSCVACHKSGDDSLAPKGGPKLTGAGNRIRSDWLRRYLSDPVTTKPGTTMPHVLATVPPEQRDDCVDALTAFLNRQREPFATVKATGAVPVVHEFWNRGDPDRGRELYHTIGCVACHEPDQDYEPPATKPSPLDQLIDQLDPEEIAELGFAAAVRRVESVPLGGLPEKYTHRSLAMFLLDPSKVRSGARMPDLRLSPSESADLAAHVLGRYRGDEVDSQAASDLATESVAVDRSKDELLIEKGRELFAELRCVNCHQADGVQNPKPSSPLDDLDLSAANSCLSHPVAGMPQYELRPDQVAAIATTLERSGRSILETAAERVQYRMLQMNCYGCHERESPAKTAQGGIGRYRKTYFETVGQVDLGDEGRLPPPLTGVGRKLTPASLSSVFRRKAAPRRTHMTIRMPAYPDDRVHSMLNDLPLADQADAATEEEVFGPTRGLAEAGRQLVDTGCIQCHPVRGESLPGVVGVDLQGVADRVHPQWFYEFVLDPGAVKKRTRMPTFFPDGQSNSKDLLDGDPKRQIAALWVYLKEITKQPLPDKIEAARSADYELSPDAKPVVLRTFMKEAGNHAIAVGFPEGVHYAFDAERIRLSIGWKGRFLDARGTWFERFTPPADPLGDSVRRLTSEPLLSAPANPLRPRSTDPSEYRFGGYRLDDGGVPTLRYEFNGWEIEDRIVPATPEEQPPLVEKQAVAGLRRTLSITRSKLEPGTQANPVTADRPLRLMVHSGKSLERVGPMSFVDGTGLKVTVRDAGHAGELSATERGEQWEIPLATDQPHRVELIYEW